MVCEGAVKVSTASVSNTNDNQFYMGNMSQRDYKPVPLQVYACTD